MLLRKRRHIILKDEEQIQKIKRAAEILSQTLGYITPYLQPGITLSRIDQLAEEFIYDQGAIPAFKHYRQTLDQTPYPGTLCLSLNEEVVHGLPRALALQEGDVLSIDCGVIYEGYYADAAYTFAIGEVPQEVSRFLEKTKEALYRGIERAVPGNRVGDIGNAIQSVAQQEGYGIVKEMVGHGVGVYLHEYPEIPNYGRPGNGPMLVPGMVIAIEPMFTMGKGKIKTLSDGWTVVTKDGSLASHYEHTVAITEKGPVTLTSFHYIEEHMFKKTKLLENTCNG
jgi:methionyl aminopeptidase